MAKVYLGLRGESLRRVMVVTIVLPAYCLLGYNNAVMGGLLRLESFAKQFPSIDTAHTTGSQQQENARIQGIYLPNLSFLYGGCLLTMSELLIRPSIVVYFLVPETRKHLLEDIDAAFEKQIAP